MVADLRYFNSLELEVDSLRSQLETQKTQFLNEIDRLSREYYYADHINAILGMYTELDEVSNLQCDYLELLEKCEGLETELSKSKMISKTFESVQKHAINLELELQQCQEKIKNDESFKVNQIKDFCKEREQYFKIQDLKAQLQEKGIVICRQFSGVKVDCFFDRMELFCFVDKVFDSEYVQEPLVGVAHNLIASSNRSRAHNSALLLRDEGVRALITGISLHKGKLSTLDIDNNIITSKGAFHVAE
uniref:NLR family CARD domain-containing protein 3 isoform X1 n=1 Tax=Tanacetum cinerariifolium TaxID=118510 RepID=A0A6L2KP33_TANCI|nr:NLR family CARD domain-containing protein 3 isoform X1 [Tanacetum cinerariifolium]